MARTSNLDTKVLKELILSDAKSRRDISNKLNISKSAMTAVSKRLINKGLVDEGGYLNEFRRGRKTILLHARPDIAYFLGTDIEGSSIRTCLLDSTTNMLASNKHAIGSDWNFERIRQQWDCLLDDAVNSAGISQDKIAGIGVGLPGRVANDGRLRSQAVLGPGKGIEIDASFIRRKYTREAMASNNAFCIAEYERRSGAARNVNSFIQIVIRYGLGVAIFSNNTYLVGDEFTTGEMGHMKIRESGPQCLCGEVGCLDTFVSGRTWRGKESLCDSELRRELSTRAKFLAIGLGNLLKILNVPLVVIDGVYNEYYSYFEKPLLNSLSQQLQGLGLPVPQIVFGEQMQFKASIGAAMLAADRLLEKYFVEKYSCNREKA